MDMTQKIPTRNSLGAGFEELQGSWRWFGSLGIGLICLGFVCIIGDVTATLKTMVAFGWLLELGGLVAIVQAFRTRTWNGIFLYLLTAVLRCLVGYLLIGYPRDGEFSLILLIASLFIVGGMFRVIGAAVLRFPSWGWVGLSGAISVALGVIVLVELPVSSLLFIGLAIGVDFTIDGSALVALSASLRGRPIGRSSAVT